MTRVIVIRGNSGSGKTTAARRLRAAILQRGAAKAVAVVEQDYFRRVVLKEQEEGGAEALALIRLVATFALARSFDVIVEGILGAEKYGEMLTGLMSLADESHAFYFDVSFDETVRRHATKADAAFGADEMRAWWKEHDVLGVDGEVILEESLSLDDAVATMLGRAYA
ncbi:MAG TPA: AAA family ATPase [Gaiellaceae bacterium]|nr:AAA family ATPase [Gaiellaceae bacterium]